MAFVEISVQDNKVAFIALNRPEKRNALSQGLVKELTEAYMGLETDERVSVVVLRGNGPAFCAGADLAYMLQIRDNSFEENLEDSRLLGNLFKTIYLFPKPTISLVQGPAIAGGCGLAFLSDFVFATNDSKFGYPEVKIGFVPALVTYFLTQKVGLTNATEMLLGGEIYLADQIKEMGAINQVLDTDTIEKHVLEFAGKMAEKNSQSSMIMTKKLIRRQEVDKLDLFLEKAAVLNAESRKKADFKKGVESFLNRNK